MEKGERNMDERDEALKRDRERQRKREELRQKREEQVKKQSAFDCRDFCRCADI